MYPRSLKDTKDSIMEEINKLIPKNRIMNNEYDKWLNEQYEIKEKNKMILMYKGTTINGLDITEEMILNSLDSFKSKPIVLNYKQKLKNYTDNETVSEFNKTNA